MGDTSINITIKGKGAVNGTIELRRLVQFADRLQKAVDRMAYALEKQAGSKRSIRDISKETSLRLIETGEGSFTAKLKFIRPAILLSDQPDLATESITELVNGLSFIGSSQNGEIPHHYDQGVLSTLEDLGKLLKNDFESFDIDVLTSSNQHFSSTYDRYMYTSVTELISEPEEKIAGVQGYLLMVDFGRENYLCNLYYEENKYIRCTFDEDAASDIENSVRQEVYAIGIATIDPVSEDIIHLRIKELTLLSEIQDQAELRDKLDIYIEENDSLASLERGWNEAILGEVMPVEGLWDGIETE